MNSYLLGNAVRLEARLRDGQTDAAVAATDIRLTLQGPNDAAGVPQPVSLDGPGLAHAVVTPNATGEWRYRWQVGGTPAAAEGAFLVTAPTVT